MVTQFSSVAQSCQTLCDPMDCSMPSFPLYHQLLKLAQAHWVGDAIQPSTDGDCSHEIKRRLLLRRKAVTNRDSILKSRDITLPSKVCLLKAMVFPVVMYRCECWTVKKAESWRTDTFELWCWRRLLRVPWTARSNQSILKEINPPKFIGRTDAETEAPILWPPDAKSQLTGKDPDARKDWGQEEKRTAGWDSRMASLTQWTWVWASSGSWWWTGRPGMLWFMGSQKVRHDWVTELNWAELNNDYLLH